MRTLATVRNYCLLIFFLILAGGAILQPANREAPRAAAVQTAAIP